MVLMTSSIPMLNVSVKEGCDVILRMMMMELTVSIQRTIVSMAWSLGSLWYRA